MVLCDIVLILSKGCSCFCLPIKGVYNFMMEPTQETDCTLGCINILNYLYILCVQNSNKILISYCSVQTLDKLLLLLYIEEINAGAEIVTKLLLITALTFLCKEACVYLIY